MISAAPLGRRVVALIFVACKHELGTNVEFEYGFTALK